MKVLITGANGQLGGALQRLAPPWAELNAIDADDCDFTEVSMLRARLTVEAPDVILNAAASEVRIPGAVSVDVADAWTCGRLTVAARDPGGLLRAGASPRLMQAYAAGR